MSFETLQVDAADGVATVVLSRPATLNALDVVMVRELTDVARALAARADVRAVLLTGEGRGFSAGADLGEGTSEPDPLLSRGENIARGLETALNPMILAWRRLPVPVVVAVNGVAAGGGVGLALVGDVVLAARSARFVQVFGPRLGLVPDLGCTWHLPRLVGAARARGLALLGESLTAEQAAAFGLIWAVCDDDDLRAEAESVAARLASGPTRAFVRIRELLDASPAGTLEEALAAEAVAQGELGDSADFAEGVRAFLEKREPRFRGE